MLDTLELLLHDLLAELLHQLLEHLPRVGVHEVVVLQTLDLAGDILWQLIELLLVLARHALHGLLELLGDLALLRLLAAVVDFVVDALAFGVLDLLQLLADVLEGVIQVGALQLLLAALAQLLHQVLQARHALAVLVLGALTEEPL